MNDIYSENSLYEFVEKTLMDTFLQLARVNLMTGGYEYLKRDDELSKGFDDVDNIYDYMKRLASEKLIYPEFKEEYLKFSDPEYVRRRVFGGEKRIAFEYKRKTLNGARWISFNIVVPEGCCEERPWVVFGLRDSDRDATAMTDAMSALSSIYHKILKIDLTKDSFEIVKASENEYPDNGTTRITDWWKSFAQSGNVHKEDLNVYNSFIETEHLKEHFRHTRNRLSCRYRRKSADGGFRWAQMDIIPSMEYSDEEVILMLFVKDVHEEHIAELRHRQELVDNFNRDALTLLYNRHKFNDDLENFKNGEGQLFTCLYIDVNGLHELNNSLGHQKGDDMLCCVADTLKKYYPEEKSYRIGGDEFVMLSSKLSKSSTERILEEVRRSLKKSGYEISAGIESGKQGALVYKTVGAAELAMRKDKEIYYKENSHIRRKRAMNDELEKLLEEKRDAEYFLRLIASKYAGVYFVDIARDTLRYIYIPDYFKKLLQRTSFSFSEAIKLYIEKYVESGSQDSFRELLEFDRLAERLRGGSSVSFDYLKVNGSKMNLKIIQINEPTGGKHETIWIFAGDEQLALADD